MKSKIIRRLTTMNFNVSKFDSIEARVDSWTSSQMVFDRLGFELGVAGCITLLIYFPTFSNINALPFHVVSTSCMKYSIVTLIIHIFLLSGEKICCLSIFAFLKSNQG
jgi:hypothetical protein